MASNIAYIKEPCECEIFQSTPAGNLLLTRVEGFGSESARTTTYEYDGAGNVVRTTGRIVKSFNDNKRFTPAKAPIPEQKSVITNERGLTSTSYTLYTAPTVRTSYSSIPTSTITAQAVVADGFTLSQTDLAAVTTTATRTYTATGMVLVQTDGRGNATTTHTDVAVRTTAVTDAAGNTTTTAYHAHFDQPAIVTDALGNTACYQYDIRGRKTAEWGTAIQPVCYGYDSADRLTSLTTFRGTPATNADGSPSQSGKGAAAGDTTTWGYHDASGMEIRKTYADGKSITKTYDAFNRLLTETDGRGVTKTHSYEHARSLLLGTTYTNVTSPTTARAYTYNHLGQLLTVADAAGVRTFSYNTYGELAADSLLAGGKTHLVTELQDAYGRSAGYTYAKDGAVQQTVSTGYGEDGRIASAGFVHGGAQKLFTYAYLPGTHLLQTLTKPNNMSLTLSYEAQRDLLTGMVYKRSNTTVATRSYVYDTLGRPTSRSTAKDGTTVNDSFGYNSRSELSTATVNNAAYSYDYDNIGNRLSSRSSAGAEDDTAAVEDSSGVASRKEYTANALNQYTAIGDFEPTYDDAGNQTPVKTSTGIWSVVYDAENRPISFTNAESATVVECTYDYMGRRATKKVMVNGAVTLHHRYLYRGYLQIACCDLTRSNHPCLWLITWDPTQSIATRPLAIQKDATWYTYGWELTKNICEVYGQHGYIRTNYTYSPFGQVTATGDVTQPIQWSSEYHDTELALVYYNYRHYNPMDGRWLGRDRIITSEFNLYRSVINNPNILIDSQGNEPFTICAVIVLVGATLGLSSCSDSSSGSTKREKIQNYYPVETSLCRGISFISRNRQRTGKITKNWIKNRIKDYAIDFILDKLSGEYGDLLEFALSPSMKNVVYPYIFVICECKTKPWNTEMHLYTLSPHANHIFPAGDAKAYIREKSHEKIKKEEQKFKKKCTC